MNSSRLKLAVILSMLGFVSIQILRPRDQSSQVAWGCFLLVIENFQSSKGNTMSVFAMSIYECGNIIFRILVG
jgi:hypothetical protein